MKMYSRYYFYNKNGTLQKYSGGRLGIWYQKKKKMPLLEFLLGLLRECTDCQRRLGGYAAGVKI